jgi:GNAT superfamily N-acetyltransferase
MSGLRISRLAAPVPDPFRSMTFPVYRHLLALAPAPRHPEQSDPRPVLPLALGAWLEGAPAGLLLAETPLTAPSSPAPPGDAPAAPASLAASFVGLHAPATPAASLAAPPMWTGARGAPALAISNGTAARSDIGAAAPDPAAAPAVLSVYVQPALRRQGVAGALFKALAEELSRLGWSRAEVVYTTGRPGSAAVERLLARGGWAPPATRTVLVHLVPREMVASELFAEKRLAALDPGFEIFPWSELPAAERDALRAADERRRWVTPGLAAWKFDSEPFDTAASIGARYRGEVVGWVIGQPISATAVRYLCSFLRKDLSRRGRILPLYRASLLRAAAAGRELATFVTPVIYPTMIRFIHRWMAPHASLVAETRGAALTLAPAGQPMAPPAATATAVDRRLDRPRGSTLN